MTDEDQLADALQEIRRHIHEETVSEGYIEGICGDALDAWRAPAAVETRRLEREVIDAAKEWSEIADCQVTWDEGQKRSSLLYLAIVDLNHAEAHQEATDD